jgi:hypothetical protein
VDQVQVEVVEAGVLQRPVERAPGGILTGVGDPQLGRDEQLVAADAAGVPARSRPVRGARASSARAMMAVAASSSGSLVTASAVARPSWPARSMNPRASSSA